ncbi:MAG: LamG domain-containing protein, partial [Planctomycetota bacterium]
SQYHGRLDEFQIYNKQLDEQEMEKVFRGGELEPAWFPSPYDGQGNVPYDTDLTWKPGAYVADTDGHDVYFGTNYDEVLDANSTVPGPNVAHDTCSVMIYGPGLLELGQTYYWRVDEVNDPCLWKGMVWKFTTADFITIDDFEDDTAQDPPTNDWYEIGSADITLRSTQPVIGKHSMRYAYDNWFENGVGVGYYSEIQSISLEPNDWTVFDQKLKLLSLWFYGNSANIATETEQMYVFLKDNDDNEFQVKYGDADWEDMTDVQIEDWQEWLIPLSHFSTNDVNLANLDNLCIGFGIRGCGAPAGYGAVYFDNIRLYPAICAPWAVPEGDLNGDCDVDFEDVEIMADAWLDSDCNCIEEYGSMPSPQGEPSLVAWYEFNDGSGGTATDSTTNDYDGTISVDDVNVFWTAPGYDGTGYALDFTGGWVSVPNGVTQLNLTDAVTVCCWVNRAQSVDDEGKIVVKGRDDWETYALEVSDENRGRFFVRDTNDRENQYSIDSSSELPVNSWIHVAGTYDGNELTLYVNGRVAANSVHPLRENLAADANDGLGIAGRWGDTGGRFIGTIDDVRIYDYALSGGEICYIASDGDGVADMVNIANVFTNESEGTKQAVNLRDFAKLAENWLVTRLWPE